MQQVVLVTGCDSGIGYATAERFARAGWTVYATGLDSDAMAPLTDLGCRTYELDVTAPGRAERVVADVVAEAGQIDCLVNNAGVGVTGALEHVPPKDVEAGLNVNVAGVHRLVRAVLPVMREQETGRVITVGSVVAYWPLPGMGAYTASKYAAAGLMDALRIELRPHNIDAVLVEPGVTRTGFMETAMTTVDACREIGREYDDLYRMLGFWLPLLTRTGSTPEAVADCVHEAATDDAPNWRYPVGWQGRLFAAFGRLPASVRDRLWSVAGGVARVAERLPGGR
ncbi:Short-chain dehydrogenase [Halogranum amylolyticum]|uniref:Short-chain dehydrogenase n=1 Tax=Halogranum amylolyticum TaxID=660520 RepID=A0A1H8SUH6_9EURY|nr:SDR family oxidoreductase [Halogranum amylolyticum]SEO82136.1 Short-chain dehydrogenase [Halogranum amylolyticum]